MLKRKPRLCLPCQAGSHGAECDGPKDCDCTFCAQARELTDIARKESELLWPLEPKDRA